MIASFRDKFTEDLFHGVETSKTIKFIRNRFENVKITSVRRKKIILFVIPMRRSRILGAKGGTLIGDLK